MVDTPISVQRMQRLKRTLLAPFPAVVQPWATRPPASPLKALALRRLVMPKVRADAKSFTKSLDDGRLFLGNTRDLLALYIYVFGVWEPNLTKFIASRLGSGDVFIDVGANLGWFSLLAAQLVGPGGRVVAIEASPLLTRDLERNIEANHFQNVRVVNAAAGSERGTVDIVHGPAEHTGLTRIQQGSAVRCDTLQELIGSDDLSEIRIMKIDVEGAEYDVIRGVAPALNALPASAEVVVEVGPERAKDSGQVGALFGAFEDAGFVPYALPNNYEPKGYLLDPIPNLLIRQRSLPTVETDIVFSHHDADSLALG
jgi:FkbM family methyltransferase